MSFVTALMVSVKLELRQGLVNRFIANEYLILRIQVDSYLWILYRDVKKKPTSEPG